MGPKRKPESKGEFLLILMKSQLDVLLGYFSDRFRISAAHDIHHAGMIAGKWHALNYYI